MMHAEYNAQSSDQTRIERSQSYRNGLSAKIRVLIWLLVVIGVVVACWLAIDFMTAKRKKWVHPEVKGQVLDAMTGQPIGGAFIKLVDSEYGGGKTTSDTKGDFKLNAVAKRYFFVAPLHGDSRVTSKIECSAFDYQSKVVEVSHDVEWDKPLVIPMDFLLFKSRDGNAKDSVSD